MWAPAHALLFGALALGAQPAAVVGHESASSGDANATCFLNNFRSFTAEQALQQGIQLGYLTEEQTFGSVAFSVALIAVGGVLLLAGHRVFKCALFSAGLVVGCAAVFFATSALFNDFPSLYNCWVTSFSVCARACVCVAAWVRAGVCVCVRVGACVRACGGLCVCLCLCVCVSLTSSVCCLFLRHSPSCL
jgi:hypothetical protein